MTEINHFKDVNNGFEKTNTWGKRLALIGRRQRKKLQAHILSTLGCLGVTGRGLSPDSIIAQMSCKDSAPATDDMLAISCSMDVSRSDETRLGDVAAPAQTHNATHRNTRSAPGSKMTNYSTFFFQFR